MNLGKQVRLQRIFNRETGRAIIVPMDTAFLSVLSKASRISTKQSQTWPTAALMLF